MTAPEIIFVRGSGRCGSKTLGRLLGGHPAIARVTTNECLPEALLDHCADELSHRLPTATAESLRAGCRAFLEAYGRELAEPDGILLHKSTGNAHRIDDLLDLWPDGRIIYLVRHPVGVVRSMVSADIVSYRGQYGYDATVETSLLRWANDLYAFTRSRAASDIRLLLVQFEALMSEPAETLQRIWGFLDLPAVRAPELGEPEKTRSVFALRPDEVRWIVDSTRDLLPALGYDPDAPPAATSVDQDARPHPERRTANRPPVLDGAELLRRAVRHAIDSGYSRIGLFGAGYLAHLLADRFADLGDEHGSSATAEVIALFDENPALTGSRIGGLPVSPPAHADELGVQVIIPITLVHQEKLIRRWRELVGPHVPVIALWGESGHNAATVIRGPTAP